MPDDDLDDFSKIDWSQYMIMVGTDGDPEIGGGVELYGPFGKQSADRFAQKATRKFNKIRKQYGDEAFRYGQPIVRVIPHRNFTNAASMTHNWWLDPESELAKQDPVDWMPDDDPRQYDVARDEPEAV